MNRVPPKLDGEGEAKLTMIACSEPPEGRSPQPLELLGERLAALNVVDGISRETVRSTLKKRFETASYAVPAHSGGESDGFAYSMEDVLRVYQRKFGENEVPACTAEALRKRTKEVRTALPAAPGRLARCDREYERNGTANLFMVHAPLSDQGMSRSPTAGRRKISPGSSGTSPTFTSPAKNRAGHS